MHIETQHKDLHDSTMCLCLRVRCELSLFKYSYKGWYFPVTSLRLSDFNETLKQSLWLQYETIKWESKWYINGTSIQHLNWGLVLSLGNTRHLTNTRRRCRKWLIVSAFNTTCEAHLAVYRVCLCAQRSYRYLKSAFKSHTSSTKTLLNRSFSNFLPHFSYKKVFLVSFKQCFLEYLDKYLRSQWKTIMFSNFLYSYLSIWDI